MKATCNTVLTITCCPCHYYCCCCFVLCNFSCIVSYLLLSPLLLLPCLLYCNVTSCHRQTITGHIKAPFDRIPLGRPDYNVHTYVVLPVKAAAAEGEIAPAGEEDKPVGWRLAEVGEPGELWLSGKRC